MKYDSSKMWLFAVICAVNVVGFADTYYWLPAHGVKADATDLSNWSIEFDAEKKAPVADAHPTRMPTASDVLCAARDFHFDFSGKSVTFKSMDAAIRSPYTGNTYWGAVGDEWTFENGSLEVEALTMRIRKGDCMLLTNDVHISCLSQFIPGHGMGDDGIADVDITEGCSLSAKATYFSNGHINIAKGGTFSTELLRNNARQNTGVIENRGSATFGEITFDSSSQETYGMTIRQLSGTMTFGGKVSRNGYPGSLTIEISGGVMRAAGAASFDDVSAASFTDGADVEVNVEEGRSMFMGDFTYGSGATLRKSGKGDLRLGTAVPDSLIVLEGGRLPLFVGRYGNGLRVMSGGEICFKEAGSYCQSFDIADGAKCSLDVEGFVSGDVVLKSESEQTLLRVKSLLDAWIAGQGLQCSVDKVGDTIVFSAPADGTFNASSGVSLDDPQGWASGSVPPAGSEVEVSGSGVVELSPSSPAFGAIRIASGTTLKLVGGTEAEPFTMPTLYLAPGAAVTVASGSYVRYAENSRVCRATADSIPVLTIERGATLFAVGVETSLDAGGVSNDIVFKNIDMRVNGTLVTPIADKYDATGGTELRNVTLWLGTAGSGETSYFAFTGDGGSIFLRNNSWTYQHAFLRLCCVQPGGIVETPSPLVFKDFTFPQYDANKTINAFLAGINNNLSSTRVRVEAENTVFDVSDTSQVGGNVDMVFSKGGTFKRLAGYFQYSVGFTLSDSATLTFGDGCTLAYGRCGDGTRPGLTFNSTGSVTLDGAALQPWIVKGAYSGSLVIRGNSRWNLADFMCDTTANIQFTYVATPLFAGFRDVVLEDGAVLDITGVYDTWGNNKAYASENWGRSISMAENVPLTGTGSIRVNNQATDDTMTVTVCCPTNTATGLAQAVDGTGSKLRFADGANWAGTVEANGCVELFNADKDGARIPSKATFGSLKFAGTFPLRVWKEDGVTFGDGISLDSAVTGDGSFTVVAQEGTEFSTGDGYDFGTYPANAKLPAVRPNPWWFESRPDGENTGRVILRLVYKPHGLTVTIR